MFPFLEVEFGPRTVAILLGTLAGNLLGWILLALGMYGYMPNWLRGAPLALAWTMTVAPPTLGIVLEGWAVPQWVAFSLAPMAGMIIATWAARAQKASRRMPAPNTGTKAL